MAIVTINDTNLTAIADAIRGKNGTTNTYKPADMPAAIQAITTGSGNTGVAANYPSVLYYNAAGGSKSGPTNVYPFDVSNATTMSFKYTIDSKTYQNPVDLTACLGYGIALSDNTYGNYKEFIVDNDAKNQQILVSYSSRIDDVEVVLDVTNYTTVTLKTNFDTYSGSGSAGTGLCIHDIVIK